MYWFDSPRRIWEYNPNMKLIVVLRNPVDRAYSHWNMEKSRGKESLPFLEALQKEELRRKESLPYQHRVYSYIDRGFYLEQLRRLWHYFSRDKCLEKVCTFLGISNFERIIPKEVHSLSYQEKIGEREKSYLLSIYEYEIKGLERMLGWDCSDWLFG